MNRRLNTLLFLIGATAVNVLLMFFYFLLLLGVAGILFPVRMGFFAAAAWVVLFAAAVSLGFLTYRWFYKFFLDHVDVERYFEPKFFKKK